MAQILFIGLIALLLGLAFCFAGYRFFRLLMPFWGFFVGFGLGAQIVALLFGGHFLATIPGWIIGIAGIISQLNNTQKYTLNPAKSANSRP